MTFFDGLGEILRRGEVLVYPTETSYAIGCVATNSFAVDRLRMIKGRESSKTLPVIVSDMNDLKQLDAKILPLHEILAKRFWPGALTMLFETESKTVESVVSDAGFVAARISSHPIAQRIAELAGTPIVSTSCNPAGLPPALSIEMAKNYFANKLHIANFIDGGLLNGGASTIVQITPDEKILVLRKGVVSTDELSQFATVIA